jgi:elongation factor Ts
VKQPEKTVKDILTEKVAKIGENIQVRRFIRYQLGGA